MVYLEVFSCGNQYIGQTGKCLNVRLGQHERNCREPQRKVGTIPEHVTQCGCQNKFENTVVLYKNGNKKCREVAEAYFIEKAVSNISSTSIKLREKEVDAIGKMLGQTHHVARSPT